MLRIHEAAERATERLGERRLVGEGAVDSKLLRRVRIGENICNQALRRLICAPKRSIGEEKYLRWS